MTVKELITLLLAQEPSCLEYELFVSSPESEEDYFVDSIALNDTQKQLFIKTAQ